LKYKKNEFLLRLLVFMTGLLVMSLGVVLSILSELGATPWDVLHVGLFQQFGLSIGTWSILVGVLILILSSLFTKRLPGIGAYLNMLLVGFFIDGWMALPFMYTPDHFSQKVIMFVVGTILMGYGIGIYISANLGAGPRDSFMLAIVSRTKMKVSHVRRLMEATVLILGWLLHGPVSYGTFIFVALIGTIVGYTLPQCQRLTNLFIEKQIMKALLLKEEKRGANL
jgi:uncharacterized membrane protein YczE